MFDMTYTEPVVLHAVNAGRKTRAQRAAEQPESIWVVARPLDNCDGVSFLVELRSDWTVLQAKIPIAKGVNALQKAHPKLMRSVREEMLELFVYHSDNSCMLLFDECFLEDYGVRDGTVLAFMDCIQDGDRGIAYRSKIGNLGVRDPTYLWRHVKDLLHPRSALGENLETDWRSLTECTGYHFGPRL